MTIVERLREALKECSDELAEYVEAHYAETKDHPAMKRRYDRLGRQNRNSREGGSSHSDGGRPPSAFHAGCM